MARVRACEKTVVGCCGFKNVRITTNRRALLNSQSAKKVHIIEATVVLYVNRQYTQDA